MESSDKTIEFGRWYNRIWIGQRLFVQLVGIQYLHKRLRIVRYISQVKWQRWVKKIIDEQGL